MQVLDGLKAGDKVVTDGLDRLRDGAKITIARTAGPGATRPRAGTAPGRPQRAADARQSGGK